MKKILKNLGISSIVYLFILVIETLYELFQIKETKEIITFLGISIKNKITSDNIMTTFGLTSKVVFTYLIFAVIFGMATLLLEKRKNA